MDLPKVLVIGATGHLGRYVLEASLASNHPTYALVRPSSLSDPSKRELVDSFKSAGAIILQGSLEDYESLSEAIRQVEIVISVVNIPHYMDELKILSAIQELGTSIKRFVVFDYVVIAEGSNNMIEPIEPLKSILEIREKIRSVVKESGVPSTHVVTYGFGSYYIASLGQLDCASPPQDNVVIAGNGDLKAFMVAEEDIAAYAIKAANDPRALKKNVHLRLPANHLSQNDLISLWETKLGKPLNRIYESEEEMIKLIKGNPSPPFVKVLKHFAFARGGHCVRSEGPEDVEAMELYPQVEYITADHYLDRFLSHEIAKSL